jgi:hypothetical protein
MVCWALEPASRPGIMEQAASMLATAATKIALSWQLLEKLSPSGYSCCMPLVNSC